MASRASGDRRYGRTNQGAVAFTSGSKNPYTALTASLLTRSGEIYGIDCYSLQIARFRDDVEGAHIPTGAVEETLIDALANFLKVAKDRVGASVPIEIIVILEGIKGYSLTVDPKYFGGSRHVGRLLANSLGRSIKIDDYDVDPFDVLLPVFKEVYDYAGYERPDVRATGRSVVNSSSISRVEYEAELRQLQIWFVESSGVCTYHDVPPHVYEDFLNAPSKGVFFNDQIKDRYRYD